MCWYVPNSRFFEKRCIPTSLPVLSVNIIQIPNYVVPCSAHSPADNFILVFIVVVIFTPYVLAAKRYAYFLCPNTCSGEYQ